MNTFGALRAREYQLFAGRAAGLAGAPRGPLGLRLRAYPKTSRGEGDRHILLRRLRKMSQSPAVLG